MSAPRKYDQEFRERAVRMYRERLDRAGESKRGARRQVGALLDMNPATLRNWVEERERVGRAGARSPRSAESRRCGRCGGGWPSWSGRTRSSRPRPRFSRRRSSTADSSDRGLHRLPPGSVRRRADLCGAGRARDADRAVHLLRHAASRWSRCGSEEAYLVNALVPVAGATGASTGPGSCGGGPPCRPATWAGTRWPG